MQVKILSYTPNPVSNIYAAYRQCYSKNYVGDNFDNYTNGGVPLEEQEQFISKMLETGHESPLEHVSFTFAVEGISRACSHQLCRHRIASYSMQSQRFVQARGQFKYIVPETIQKYQTALTRYKQFMKKIQEMYNTLISLGFPPEDARYVLPNACETKIVFTMNCRSLINFFSLRCCNRSQAEVRNLAWTMLRQVRKILPCVFNNVGPKCKMLGYCPEIKKYSCGKYPTKEETIEAANKKL